MRDRQAAPRRRRLFNLRSWAGEFVKQSTELRPPRTKFFPRGGIIVFKLEAGADCASEQRPLAARRNVRALPHAARNDNLRALAVGKIAADLDYAPASICVELQHLDGIARVEVKDLVGFQAMHLAECAWLEQVVDRGCRVTRARITPVRERHWRQHLARLVGADVTAALARMRDKSENLLCFFGGHWEYRPPLAICCIESIHFNLTASLHNLCSPVWNDISASCPTRLPGAQKFSQA